MSQPELYSAHDSVDSEVQELRQELQKANRVFSTQMTALVLCLTVFNFSANIFIYKQLSYINRQQPDMQRSIDNYLTNTVPQMNKFYEELRAYAKNNRDFSEKVLQKFAPSAATNGPVTSAQAPKK